LESLGVGWWQVNARAQLLAAFAAAIQAAMPDRAVCDALRFMERPAGRTIVVGAGKAAAGMAKAFEDAWEGPLEGVVVTRHGHALVRPARIRLLEAGHPVPDASSEQAARAIIESVRDLSSDDLVIVLISGGGSALMVAPHGVTFEEKLRIYRQLLNSGADIGEMNTVRKHLSWIKGGRLALEAAPARVVALIVSDVVGDDLSTIASGPTVPDPTGFEDAIRVFHKYGIDSQAALEHFLKGQDETPKSGHPAFARVHNQLIVTNTIARTLGSTRESGRIPSLARPGLRRDHMRSKRVFWGQEKPFCPAVKPRSPCVAVGVADAIASFCWRWPSSLRVRRTCMPSPVTPTALMA
jgi:glycerate 2-kinase